MNYVQLSVFLPSWLKDSSSSSTLQLNFSTLTAHPLLRSVSNFQLAIQDTNQISKQTLPTAQQTQELAASAKKS